jgi:3-dehydroquinate dehydratase
MKLEIINGPNLNLLGKREPDVYGNTGFEPFFKRLEEIFPDISFIYSQSNVEGEIVSLVQEAGVRSQRCISLTCFPGRIFGTRVLLAGTAGEQSWAWASTDTGLLWKLCWR